MHNVPSKIAQFIDPNVHAADDFYRFVNGTWLKEFEIPAQEATAGVFYNLRLESERRCREIVSELAQPYLEAGKREVASDSDRLGALYAAYMNTEARDKVGTKLLLADLAGILAGSSNVEVMSALNKMVPYGVSTAYSFGVEPDFDDPTKQTLLFSQGGIGLPDESYYREEKYAEILAAYEKHIAKMLVLTGAAALFNTDAKDASESVKLEENATKLAALVLELETKLAACHWDVVKTRDLAAQNNPMTLAELTKTAPDTDWTQTFADLGLSHVTSLTLCTIEPVVEESRILATCDLAALKAWATWRVVSSALGHLTEEIGQANFEFTRLLTGASERKELWRRALNTTSGLLGELIGKIYVERHFPASSKAKMEKLVDNLLAAYRVAITNLEWMSEETKKEALVKLDGFTYKIGYPEKFRTYENFAVDPENLYASVARGFKIEYDHQMQKAGQPTDPADWEMHPQDVNAYYHPMRNEIVFPAAILQSPFFDPEADDAWNYGGIGAVIGHEIGHGFDDQGSQFDGKGQMRMWWTEEDLAKFKERTKALIAQYNAYIPSVLADRENAENYHVNGEFTIGENIGDLGGLGIACKAYELALKEQGFTFETAPVLEDVTALQRFFYSWALVWQFKIRPEMATQLIATDPHSPAEFRVNGVVKNIDAFYAAFDVKAGDALYLPPEQRVRIWQ